MIKSRRFAKVIRILTVAPIMAMITLYILYELPQEIFKGLTNYIISVIFLVVLPLLAYPLQPLFPKFRNKGREGQRSLAIIMAVLGYLLGIISTVYFDATRELLLIYLIYLISGLGILFFNKVLGIRASGHACGVVGPISILAYFVGAKSIFGVGVVILVYWTSIKTNRHTLSELLWGSIIPIFALVIGLFLT